MNHPSTRGLCKPLYLFWHFTWQCSSLSYTVSNSLLCFSSNTGNVMRKQKFCHHLASVRNSKIIVCDCFTFSSCLKPLNRFQLNLAEMLGMWFFTILVPIGNMADRFNYAFWLVQISKIFLSETIKWIKLIHV